MVDAHIGSGGGACTGSDGAGIVSESPACDSARPPLEVGPLLVGQWDAHTDALSAAGSARVCGTNGRALRSSSHCPPGRLTNN